jgi:hypothetical protein
MGRDSQLRTGAGRWVRGTLTVRPFEDLLQARRWVTDLVAWYNEEHRHSAIGFVTPSQRHAAQDHALLEGRSAVYERARQAHPRRWSKHCRSWHRLDEVHLNPDSKPQTKESEALKNTP